MFGDGYPVTSLRRDDPRTLRFLTILSSELRVADRNKRVLQVQARTGDPGPTYLEEMAVLVEHTRDLYVARQFEAANEGQKKLANWVARLGDDRDAEPPSARIEGAQLIEHWKLIWKLAENAALSAQVISGNASVLSEKERTLGIA